jgi:DNA repair ATPase RecN
MIHPLILIISLLRYVDKYNDSPISDVIKQLEEIREVLVNIRQQRDEFKDDLKNIGKRLLEQPSFKKKYFQQFGNDQRNRLDSMIEGKLRRLSEKLIALKSCAESVQPAVEYLWDAAQNLTQAAVNLERKNSDLGGRVMEEVQRWTQTCIHRRVNVQKLAYDIGHLTGEVSCPFLSRL